MDETRLKRSPVKIRIQNYQSIEDATLEVDGFRTIVGRTNIGKSAIMRAISSAILNDPVIGKVRKGSKFCTVDLSSKGWGFRWEKGDGGVNRYTIGGKVYDKIGQKQLDEVVRMGFGSVRIGDQEIQPWWAPQFNPLFLLDKSGPQVTDFISEVSRLTVLQDAIVMAARAKRKATDEAKAKSDESVSLRDKVSRVSGLDPLLKLQEDLDGQQESISEYEGRVASGERVQSKMADAASKIKALSDVSRVSVPADKVGDQVSALSSMNAHWRGLEAYAHKIISLRDIPKIHVPDPPSTEMESLVAAGRLSYVGPLKLSVAALEKIGAVKVPDPVGAEDYDRILKASEMKPQLAALAFQVSVLSAPTRIPEAPDGFPETTAGLALAEGTVGAAADVASLEARLSSLELSLAALDKELESIPSCPTCKRPVAGPHAHAVTGS